MKILLIALLISLFVFPAIAYAQDPTVEPTAEVTPIPDTEPIADPPLFPIEVPEELPPSAEEGLKGIALVLATLSGLIITALTDAIKKLPFLNEEDQSKISGPAANLLAAVVSIIVGYLMGYLGTAAGFLDSSGVWQVILFSWPAAKAWFEVEQHRKNAILVDLPVATLEATSP